MKKPLIGALACALTASAFAAPAAHAGTACDRANAAADKYAGELFEVATIWMSDEVELALRAACEGTP